MSNCGVSYERQFPSPVHASLYPVPRGLAVIDTGHLLLLSIIPSFNLLALGQRRATGHRSRVQNSQLPGTLPWSVGIQESPRKVKSPPSRSNDTPGSRRDLQ